MKVKLKNASGAARFFLSHGEKLGMAAVAIVAGLLITSSLGRPGLDKRPDDLTNSAKAATDHYQQMSWEKIAQTNPTEVVDASKVVDLPAKAFVSPVDIDAFPPLPLINPPVVDEVSLRKDPALLAVLSLEAYGGSGMWASADPEAIKRNFLDAIKKQEEQRMKQDEEQRKAEEGGPEGGGGERGGFGGRGGGEGFGGPGMMGVGAITADKVLVLPPPTGAMTQGFEDIKIRSWVTVVGKVPVKKQFDAYEAALSMSHGYSSQTDMPIYKGYQVQRAEVTEAGVGEWASLAKVVDKTILADMAKSPIPSVDPINPKYNHPLLTHPLPSMLLRQWGKEVTHSELPIPTPEDLLRESMGPEATTPEGTADKPKNKEPGANADDPFADTNKRSQLPPGAGGEMGFGRGGGGRGEMGMGGRGGGLGGRGGMMGGRGEMGGSGYGRGEMGGGRGEMGGGGFGRGEGGMGMMRPPGLGADGSAEMMLPEYAWDGTTKFALFRYFDATVQPGHRYRYRVRLVLADVNADKLDKYLDKEVTERKKANKARYRFTEYSEPSTTASVPEPGLAYVAGAKVSASAAIEGEAKLVVKALDPLHAAEGALGGAYSRGSVLNHLASKAEIIWSSSPDLTQPDVASGKVPESPDFDFVTDLAVLDFQGGESLNKSRELTAPTTVLLMDGSGKMMLKEELDDRLTVQEYTMILEHKKQAEKAAREGAGGGPGEGRGGGGRGGGGRGGRG